MKQPHYPERSQVSLENEWGFHSWSSVCKEVEQEEERPGEGRVSRGKQAHQVHPKEGQACLGDVAGLVPDHRNKVNTTIKRVTRKFCFLGAYKSYGYAIM